MKKLFLLLAMLATLVTACDELYGDANGTVVTTLTYTSTDGNIVEPYSGEYNGHADALVVFGANILSNTYEDGMGVISFDGHVTTIGISAFAECSNLMSITIPEGVISIDNGAFYNCNNLTSVTIPDGVTTIRASAFSYCANLADVTLPESVTEIREMAFFGCSSLTDFTIPNSITTINHSTFSGCTNLTSVTIPESVTEIDGLAFYECSSLRSVTIPDSVTAIGNGAFCGCSNMREFYGKYASEDNRCLIIDGVLHSFAPEGLIEYNIPESVTKIGDYAFQDCKQLTNVTIPQGVAIIGNQAFTNCISLTSTTIPEIVIAIGYAAFWDCKSLTNVYCMPTTPPEAVMDWGIWMAFDHDVLDPKIYVPTESVDSYKTAEGWSEYADRIAGYDF